METKKMTRRERQAEILKKEILEAAIQVFKEFGYEKATTKKIAERAEVSEGTLYNYFESKRDILISLFKILIEGIKNNLMLYSTDHDAPIEKLLSTGMANQFKHINSLSIITLFLHEARIDPEVQHIFTEMILSARQYAIELFKRLESDNKVRKINYSRIAILMSIIGIGYTSLLEICDNELTQIPMNELLDDFADILANGLIPKSTN